MFIVLLQQEEYDLVMDDQIAFVLAETVAGDREDEVILPFPFLLHSSFRIAWIGVACLSLPSQ